MRGVARARRPSCSRSSAAPSPPSRSSPARWWRPAPCSRSARPPRWTPRSPGWPARSRPGPRLPLPPHPATAGPRVRRGWDGDRLQGTATSVADGELADLVVVPALRRRTRARARRGLDATPRPSLDQTRRLSDLGSTASRPHGGRGRGGGRRRPCRAARRRRPPGVRAARRRELVPGRDGRVRQGPHPVRAAGGVVPGAEAPTGRPLARGHLAAGRRPVRRRPAGAFVRHRSETGLAVAVAQAYACRTSPCTRPRRRCSCTAGSA